MSYNLKAPFVYMDTMYFMLLNVYHKNMQITKVPALKGLASLIRSTNGGKHGTSENALKVVMRNCTKAICCRWLREFA